MVYTKDTYFKFTARNGRAQYRVDFSWPLPQGEKPGDWRELQGPLVLYVNGFHFTAGFGLFVWNNEELYEIEVAENRRIEGERDKFATTRMRLQRRVETWNAKTALLCAWDFIEMAIDLCAEPPPHLTELREVIASGRAIARTENAEHYFRVFNAFQNLYQQHYHERDAEIAAGNYSYLNRGYEVVFHGILHILKREWYWWNLLSNLISILVSVPLIDQETEAVINVDTRNFADTRGFTDRLLEYLDGRRS